MVSFEIFTWLLLPSGRRAEHSSLSELWFLWTRHLLGNHHGSVLFLLLQGRQDSLCLHVFTQLQSPGVSALGCCDGWARGQEPPYSLSISKLLLKCSQKCSTEEQTPVGQSVFLSLSWIEKVFIADILWAPPNSCWD